MSGETNQQQAWLRFLWRDPLTRLWAVLVLGFGAIHAVVASRGTPLDGPPAYAAEALVLLVALAAVLRRAFEVESRLERRFWFLVAASLFAYLSTFTFYLDWPTRPGRTLVLVESLLNLLFYAALLMAVVTTPHLDLERDAAGSRRRLDSTGTVVFIIGLLAYFVVIPEAVGAQSTEFYAPHLFVYGLLDLAVALAFLYKRRNANDPTWRTAYAFLSASSALWAVADLREAFQWWTVQRATPSPLSEVLGYLPHLATLLAVRSRRYEHTGSQQARGKKASAATWRFGGTIPLYLAFLPLMHVGLHAAGALDPSARTPREVAVLVLVALLAGLGLLRQARTEKERRALEEQARHSQKMEAVGRMAGGIAHDFNNLLTVVVGCSELARVRIEDKDKLLPLLENIGDAADRGKALTSQLLSFSRRQPVDAQVVDLNEVVEDTGKMLRRLVREEVALSLHTRGRPCWVRADRSQIDQVIVNLALNSIDAMPTGGRLTVTTDWLVEPQDIPVADRRVSPCAVLRVEDTGVGMDADTRRRAFDPFFTTKDVGKGTGLGLTTAYGIVQQHGGTLVAASEPGVGTTMTVYLPGAEPVRQETAAAERATARAGEAAKETILLVEDDERVRRVVRDALESEGYRVLEADCAKTAKGVADETDGPIDLLLTDVVMPGESGPELFRELARDRPRLEVLLMTGYSPESSENGSLSRIDKPFTTDDLLVRLRTLLEAT